MTRFLLVFAASCSTATAQPDPCSASALGVSNAVALVAWAPPSGCSVVHPPARAIIYTQSDLAALLHCTGGASLPAFDFDHDSLLVVTWPASPAAVGLDALDDGSTITLVAKSRTSCPHEAPPTPITATTWFAIPSANAQRNFGDRSCTVESRC
jgi:hypothetical protein